MFQFYPESDDQVKFIMSFATKAGFGGGLCVDYPNSTKKYVLFLPILGQFSADDAVSRKKFYLVLFAG